MPGICVKSTLLPVTDFGRVVEALSSYLRGN